MTIKNLDYWGDNAGSTQTIQIQWSFQLHYLKISLFDKPIGTGLLTQVPGIWTYRSAILSYPLLDPITLFFPCVFLFSYFLLKIYPIQPTNPIHICAKFSQQVAAIAEVFYPQKLSSVIGTKFLLRDRIHLLGIWRHCKILRVKMHIGVCP